MKILQPRLICILLVTMLLTSCSMKARSTPVPMPPVPQELTELPRTAVMEGEGVEFAVFEFPGIESSDNDSPTSGFNGKTFGYVKSGVQVTILKYAWSSANRSFYVYVQVDEQLEGWTWFSVLEFPEEE